MLAPNINALVNAHRRETAAKGNIVADAYHAALAIEAGCDWVSTDRDYSRFIELRWSSPLT